MRYAILAVATCRALLAAAQGVADAPEVNNPASAQYIAKTPGGGNQNIQAEIAVQGNPNGTGAWFTININGPSDPGGGPFLYHIHEKAVPSDGNCSATLAHLDPYQRGEAPPCDASAPSTCQVGDLSGKHGKIQDLPGFSVEYTDAYISLVPNTPAFIGDKSFVLHYANKTRIMCVNFAAVTANSTSGSSSPYGNSTSTGGAGSSGGASFPVAGGNSSTSTSGTTATGGSTGGAGGAAGGGSGSTGTGTGTGTTSGAATVPSSGASATFKGVHSLGLATLLAGFMVMFA